MPPLGPGLTEDKVAEMVQHWLRESRGLTVCQRYNRDLAEPLPVEWKPAIIGVDLVAGQPGEPPTWIIEAMGDLNNAPHYSVHFSSALYTLISRTRPDDFLSGRHLALAVPFYPEGKVPSPYAPVFKRLHGTRFLDLRLELLLAAPGPRVTHLSGESLEEFLATVPIRE